MSIIGALLRYETKNNNNVNQIHTKRSNLNICSSKLTPSLSQHSTNSMGKIGSAVNSNTLKPVLGVIPNQEQSHRSFKDQHFPKAYMNTKRKHSKHNIYGHIYHDKNNYLHLNSLWSIWYGVLFTLIQGYLAIHGASRFLGCSLIPWKMEPVAELNLQIILSGLVFVLLPFFFTSAVFKVGNMANDGIKLASGLKDRICSKVVNDGFEGESYTGSIKTLWMHGGPTAAFIHILIAMCLLLPRILLEGRIIGNGLLSREAIWRTELDFMAINRNNLVGSLEHGNDFNENMFPIQANDTKNNTNLLLTNVGRRKSNIFMGNANNKYIEFSDVTEAAVVRSVSKEVRYSKKTTVPSIFTSSFADEYNAISTTKEYVKENIYENVEATTIANVVLSNTTKKRIAKNENKLISVASHNTYHNKYNRVSNHNGKIIRKLNRQRKTYQQLRTYENNDWIKNQNNLNLDFIDMDYLDNSSIPNKNQSYNENNNEVLNLGQMRVTIYPKLTTETSMTIRDSDIHIVKSEILPQIIPSAAVSRNSKVIAIKQKIKRAISSKKTNFIEIEPEVFLNDSSEYIAEMYPIETSTISTVKSTLSDYNVARLDGFAGMLQLFFGIEKAIDVNTFNNPPSAEFVNLLFALLVWCVRYPAVFWTSAKSFATIFSIQMVASAADIVFSYLGISVLFKLQIYSEEQPIQNQGLVLNANVTLALFLLSVILILSSSMVLYLFGHGRLSAKMRDRSIITLSSNKSWTYFAHCASLCYILALCVVKAPLLNDLNATYRNSFHCSTFVAALVSVIHIVSWIVVWMILTVKRNWSFKLPTLEMYTTIGKATTQPLLTHKKRSLTSTTEVFLNKVESEISETELKYENSGKLLSKTSQSDMLNGAKNEKIYWPKVTPSSPKLKVTFNEVTTTSDDHHHHSIFDENEQNDGKRNSVCGASVCFTSIKGEIDDGEYATLRSDPTTIGGNTSGDNIEKLTPLSDGVNFLHLSEYNKFLPFPRNMTSSVTTTNHTTTVSVNSKNTYVNFFDDCASKGLGDSAVKEEDKILECGIDDTVTYASAKYLEQHTADSNGILKLKENCYPMNQCSQTHLSPSLEYLISPLAPVKAASHTNKAHIFTNSIPRCLRGSDSGTAHEDLTPRSDTNSFGTECTISPPEKAPSESSSGIHSGEEREIEVIIRPRTTQKHFSKWVPPAIQEEPNGRHTNMRMSSFAGGINLNSATLPPPRFCIDEKFDYTQHCSTMPLPTNNNKHSNQQSETAVCATSAQCMSQTQSTSSNVSSFKAPLYVNSGFVISGHKQRLYEQKIHRTSSKPQQQLTHTILSNGVRYSNPIILRRHPFLKATDSQISFATSTIPEDRDSANFSMISEQDSIYAKST